MKLEVKNATLIYPRSILPPMPPYQGFKDVSFTLVPGKIYGLIGRNGAGKTSLLSVVAAFRKHSRGEVLLDDIPIFDNGELMQHIKFIYQKDYNSEFESTHPKLLKFIKQENEHRPDFDFAYAQELVKRFNLPTNKRPHKLSKGQQSALQVVIGLSSRAKITIFDEAYVGMDAPTRDLFYKEVLRDQERHPRTIIMSTHLVSEMEYLFDEVLMIHNGELIKAGAYDEITALGTTITGPNEAVNTFANGKTVLSTQTLGGFKKITLSSALDESDLILAQDLGLEISSMTLQDLFIHLTGGANYE